MTKFELEDFVELLKMMRKSTTVFSLNIPRREGLRLLDYIEKLVEEIKNKEAQ